MLPVEERGFISAHNLKGKAVLVEVAVGVAGGFGIWSLQSLVTLEPLLGCRGREY